MNRFAFLGSQTDAGGQEWCYILDTETGTTLKSPVKAFGTVDNPAPKQTIFKGETTAPSAVKKVDTDPQDKKPTDPSGEIETPEQRNKRLANPKVPRAFSSKMYMDPSLTEGVTDTTPQH